MMNLPFEIAFVPDRNNPLKGTFRVIYGDGSFERATPTDYLLYQLVQNGGSEIASSDKEPEEEPAPASVEMVEPVEPIESDTETLLHINSATAAEVDELPQIGAASASKIVDNRGDGYADLADLKARSGITHLDDADWDAIAKLITFE